MGEAMKPHLSNCAWLQRNFQLGDRLGLVRIDVLPGFSGGRVDGRFPGCVVSVLQQVGLLLCKRVFLRSRMQCTPQDPAFPGRISCFEKGDRKLVIVEVRQKDGSVYGKCVGKRERRA